MSATCSACSAHAADPSSAAAEALDLLNRSSSSIRNVKAAHARIIRRSSLRHPSVLSRLVRLYAEAHRRPDLAQSLLFSFFPTSPFLWNLTIRAHFCAGDPFSSLRLLRRMLAAGVPPDKFTFPFATRAAASLGDPVTASVLHAAAIKSPAALYHRDPFLHHGLIELYSSSADPDSARKVFDEMRRRNVVSWTALISGFISCGELDDALEIFEAAPERNVVTWTAVIDGCARLGRPDEAFELFWRMLGEDVQPNEFTLVALLIACTEMRSLRLGRWVHELACKNGALERSVHIGTALVDMFSKCGSLEDAVRVFDQMPGKSLATWNSFIAAFAVHGRGVEAFTLFDELRKQNVRPDGITFAGLLIACVREKMVSEGCRLFVMMIEEFGIIPNGEHCKSMAMLLGEQGNEKLKKNLVRKLDDIGHLQMLLEQCQLHHGDVVLQRLIHDHICGSNGSLMAEPDNACVELETG